MKIAAGFHQLTAAEYHGDPAPEPSLSNSIAQMLLDRSPYHAWRAHPRLGGQAEEESIRRLDLGSVAHALLLGEGRTIQVIEADDYRGKDAKADRDKARAAGLLPVLRPDLTKAEAMVAVARKAIEGEPEIAELFQPDGGKSEMVGLWQEEDDTWCRMLLDRTNLRVTLDYKSCPNAAPPNVARNLYGNGYHIQDAWYRRGLDALDLDGRGRRKFYFLFQEIEEPFACSFHEIDATGRAMGDRLIERALAVWRECRKADRWPSYPPGIHRAEMPPWLETSILAQEDRDFDHQQAGKRIPLAEIRSAG